MNKREKEVLQAQLDKEKAVLEALKKQYARSLRDIEQKAKVLMFDIQQLDEALNTDGLDDRSKEVLESRKQSKIYQKQHQEALKKQVEAIAEKLHSDEYSTIEQYLKECYTDAYVGTMYDIAGQGIPVITPIDQTAVVRAVTLDSKISTKENSAVGKLYAALGVDKLKTAISAEISRGIATGLPYAQIAKNLDNVTKAKYSNTMRIVRTEGHRIQNASTFDAQQAAKAKGCNVVKQWDSTLDGKTRPTHRELDGQIREVEEYFEAAGKKAKFPGDFNDPAEDCNCRCTTLTRARWALGEDELKTLQDRARFFGLDKSKSFEDYKKKYLKAAEKAKSTTPTITDANENGTKLLGEIYEWHRIGNNLNVVPYEELVGEALNPIKANYGKLQVEVAEAFNGTLSKLASEYDTPLQRIRTFTKDEALSDSFAFVNHNYSVDSAELAINPVKMGNYDKMVERIKELSNRGYAVKIPDELADKYIVTHEFAHTLINLEQPLSNKTNWVGADYGKIKKARKEVMGVYEKYIAEVEQLTKNKKAADMEAMLSVTEESWKAAREATAKLNAVKLSNYSLENADEFMAEAFTNEKIGVASNPYAKEVLDILNKYFMR